MRQTGEFHFVRRNAFMCYISTYIGAAAPYFGIDSYA